MIKRSIPGVFLTLTYFCYVSMSSNTAPERAWREEYYNDMLIDHFSYSSDDENKTFDLRYLINDTWWDPNGGPIFFYTGNEGKVEDFAENTGLMWDWAPDSRAMLVFAEHRYYGKSLPYGNLSFERGNMAYLTVDQALADFATLLAWIKTNITGAANSPVIAFGGSYGGMLAAWVRVKYPNLVSGAVASSAPILHLPEGGAPCHSYGDTTLRAMSEAARDCDKIADNLRSVISDLAKTEEGREQLNTGFRLCNHSRITSDEGGVRPLRYFVSQTWAYAATANYPYAASFFKPMPAFPLKAACKYLTQPSPDRPTFISNILQALNVIHNYTGNLECLPPNGSPDTNKMPDTDALAWAFQQCADLTLLNECNNGKDIFKPYQFRAASYSDSCYEVFGVRPRWNWLTLNYGLRRIRLSSNIIFTSGRSDPWDGSTIKQSSLRGADPSLVAIQIDEGAHHYDLQGSHPQDTQEIINVRARMKGIVQGWIQAATRVVAPAPPLLLPTLAPSDISADHNTSATPDIAKLGLGLQELVLSNFTTPAATGPGGSSTTPRPTEAPPAPQPAAPALSPQRSELSASDARPNMVPAAQKNDTSVYDYDCQFIRKDTGQRSTAYTFRCTPRRRTPAVS